MTVEQLERAVARLGFAPGIEDGAALLRDAAARALDEVAAVRPRLTRVSLFHLPALPIYLEGEETAVTGEKTVSLPSGRSFFLRILGSGSLIARREGGGEAHYPFSSVPGVPAAIGGALPEGDGRITLRITASGDYRLLVLAVYDAAFGDLPPDPTAPRDYDLSSLFPAYGSLVEPPKTRDGRTLCEGSEGDYTLDEGKILRLSPHTRGEIRLTYRRRLSLPETGELPVSEEEAALLPLFCAAYVYLEDDPEKASFYLARFHEGLVRLREPIEAIHRFRDATGWG